MSALGPDRSVAARRGRRRAVARPLRPTDPVALDGSTAYAGLVARTIAFVLDALIVNATAAIVTAGLGVALSVLVGDASLGASGLLAGATAFGLWSIGYFVVSWSVGGQTIGDAVMGIRVVAVRDGRPLRPCRALLRFVALSLGALPALAGIWILVWDRRRRAFHDRVARTVVVRVDGDRSVLAAAPTGPVAVERGGSIE